MLRLDVGDPQIPQPRVDVNLDRTPPALLHGRSCPIVASNRNHLFGGLGKCRNGTIRDLLRERVHAFDGE